MTARSTIIVDDIPAELAELPQWVAWRYEERNGKPTKVPVNPKSQSRAQSCNPATWGTLQQALSAARRGYDGVGFVFSDNDAFFGIDLDACRNPATGELTPWAAEIISAMHTYTEVSPSGYGVKLVARGKLPDGTRHVHKPKGVPTFGDKTPEVAIYDRARFWCMTGRRLNDTPTTCEPRQAEIESLLARLFSSKPTANSKQSGNGHAGFSWFEKLLSDCASAADGERSERDFALCAAAARHGFNADEIWARVNGTGKFAESGRDYFDRTWQRASEAAATAPPGNDSGIANYEVAETDDGEKQIIPISMTDIIDTIHQRMYDWPRRVDNMLFVDDPKHGLDYFDRRTTAGLFGWLRRHNKVQWGKGGNVVSQAELFAEVERTAQRYEAIELLPHEPPIDGIYYRGEAPKAGDGSHLRQLLDRFRPETTIDRDLIQAAMMTAFWGGLPGCRPAFVVTSDDGRGVGKSKVPEVVGYLCGGHIDVSAGEEIETLKTRMLTPVARTKRIALMDNVKTLRLSWAELEAMITGPIISGRQLYVGEGQRPNLLTWFITLNGVSMATDMAQRSIIIKVVRGKNDGPWWEQTRQFIDQHRGEIIGDIIGALRAEPFPLAEFSRWATWEQHVLCRLPEPGEAQRLILERQAEANCEMDEAEIIEEFFANKLWGLKYHFRTAQVRIPVEIAAQWFSVAVGERTKTAAVTRRLNQMSKEGQLNRIAPDPSRHYGRAFIWTGESADVTGEPIDNSLRDRLAAQTENRREF